MDYGSPDQDTVLAALALAARAPSARNSQPWHWRLEERCLHLHARPDPERRPESLLDCGAALHHLRVALAASGWRSRVHRLPEPADPSHLATVLPYRGAPSGDERAMAAAIPLRRTDRRRYSSWFVPRSQVAALIAHAGVEGAVVRIAGDSLTRRRLAYVVALPARMYRLEPDYLLELAAAARLHATPEALLADEGNALVDEDGQSMFLALGTRAHDRLSRLRAGEAMSALLLAATALGLATCALTEPLASAGVSTLLRTRVLDGAFPHAVLRLGRVVKDSAPLPPTPRRPLADLLSFPAALAA
ncbi:nitroreductase family protein [Amycolatopsis nigrescens]|uniref:nitroreductase family protein n=1 Tax=Amycolatopsis nigrescens TaxID=381445 RepID=UPI00037A8F9C|nr:nitroreductase family protein [Amycolatopsis nigrescens]